MTVPSTNASSLPAVRRAAERVLLLAILLLALALRLHRLDAQSVWYDEAVTAQVAGQGLAELTRWTADDIQPPLYYYVVAGWTRLIGAGVSGVEPGGEWALRFPSAFFGVLGVSLAWAVAWRVFRPLHIGRLAAPAAALLMAVSPLHVYYSQEARMYTLLVALGLLAGYTLMGLGRTWQRGLVFVLAGAALLYTHYFGALLLLALGLCWLVAMIAAEGRRKSALLTGLLSFAAIALLYLPWLPSMLGRYQQDRSYWEGALKLGEALRHVALSFTTGAPETMLEAGGLRLLPWFGLAGVIAVAALLWQEWTARRADLRGPSPVVALLVVLLLPVMAVLLLASRSPKFNPRYLMLVSPAYLLLLAGGIAALAKSAHRTAAVRLAASVLLAALVAISAIGLRNWFTDPAFTKAQWRELAAHVRAERQPDEAVVVVSGHAYPAWRYYAPDIAAVRLPDIAILDVQAVLGFGAGAPLAEGLAGRSGAWLVQWQAEVVDPAGFVPYFLDRAGQELPVDRQFWHLGLRRWQLDPRATFPAEPQPQHDDGANFDHKLALLGWDDPQASEQGPTLTLYWRVLNTLTEDYQLSLIVEDASGQELGRWDGRPAGYDYPTNRWQVGQALFGRVPLPLPVERDRPLSVTVAVYDHADPSGLDIRDVADNPAGKRVRLGPIVLTQ
jgi:mannosyltransferase